MANETIFWQQTAPPAPDVASLSGDVTCDVVVIGGGFTGLRAALDLAEAGTDVVVLEAGDIAHGASGRSGGQVNPMLPAEQPEQLRKTVGTPSFERMTAAVLGSADALFGLIERLGIACDARQNGWLRLNHCPAAAARARVNAALWNAHGAQLQEIDEPTARRLSGAHGYGSGILAPQGGAVQPLALARGMAAACLAAGARLFSAARVTALSRRDGHWHLEAAGHRVRASQVIVATNGYTDGLIPGLRRSVMALHPIQIATDPLPQERLEGILPEGHTVSDTRRLIMYARREPGGQVVFGGIGFSLGWLGRHGFSWLLRDAPRIFPSLRGVVWRHRWGGRIAMTADRLPHMHAPEPGLTIGLGYNGRGVAMAFLMGQQLARHALGAAAEELAFPVTKITPYMGGELQAMGAGLGMAALRVRDRLDIAGWTGQSSIQGVH